MVETTWELRGLKIIMIRVMEETPSNAKVDYNGLIFIINDQDVSSLRAQLDCSGGAQDGQ